MIKLIVKWLGPESPMGPGAAGIMCVFVIVILAMLAVPPAVHFYNMYVRLWS